MKAEEYYRTALQERIEKNGFTNDCPVQGSKQRA
jgi:hypothetical protein